MYIFSVLYLAFYIWLFVLRYYLFIIWLYFIYNRTVFVYYLLDIR